MQSFTTCLCILLRKQPGFATEQEPPPTPCHRPNKRWQQYSSFRQGLATGCASIYNCLKLCLLFNKICSARNQASPADDAWVRSIPSWSSVRQTFRICACQRMRLLGCNMSPPVDSIVLAAHDIDMVMVANHHVHNHCINILNYVWVVMTDTYLLPSASQAWCSDVLALSQDLALWTSHSPAGLLSLSA